ncbi:hypothetical protein HD597_012890 [Nonomuraea thailandensis]|uniref:Uncharacterized protein n=1 Tax=Nonomuraea thailandensis TaxID=1188745 RepID=A0A9X2KD69_9ACTN|nr:hypothetical protein [Nonomuraea thailandensis]MCP2365786.1 hypothetical protein [Nonomuraea thailandensis]
MSTEHDDRSRLAERVARMNTWQLALAKAMASTTTDASSEDSTDSTDTEGGERG